eukprot:710222-Pelagomonas_calceolata.AAC.3
MEYILDQPVNVGTRLDMCLSPEHSALQHEPASSQILPPAATPSPPPSPSPAPSQMPPPADTLSPPPSPSPAPSQMPPPVASPHPPCEFYYQYSIA